MSDEEQRADRLHEVIQRVLGSGVIRIDMRSDHERKLQEEIGQDPDHVICKVQPVDNVLTVTYGARFFKVVPGGEGLVFWYSRPVKAVTPLRFSIVLLGEGDTFTGEFLENMSHFDSVVINGVTKHIFMTDAGSF